MAFDHLSFAVKDLAKAAAFYDAALAPLSYSRKCAPDSYAAFVIGPDGDNIEAALRGAADAR